MYDNYEPPPLNELERAVQYTLEQGQDYADAFLSLDPRLERIDPNSLAAAFDVGKGTDGVAFAKLGFVKAIVTNSPSALYEYVYQKNAAS